MHSCKQFCTNSGNKKEQEFSFSYKIAEWMVMTFQSFWIVRDPDTFNNVNLTFLYEFYIFLQPPKIFLCNLTEIFLLHKKE